MTPREREILCTTGRYRVIDRRAIDAWWFGRKRNACRNVVQTLTSQGWMRCLSNTLPGRVSLYQLTTRTAIELHIPLNRTWPLGSVQIHKYFGVLRYCCTGDVKRKLLEQDEVARLFGDFSPNGGLHLLEQQNGSAQVLRTSVLGPATKPASVVREVRNRLKKASGDLRTAISCRSYGFAVLVARPERQRAVMNALERAKLYEHASIQVRVVSGPNPSVTKD